MSQATIRERAIALRAQGRNARQVAVDLGISLTFARELVRKRAEFPPRMCEGCGSMYTPTSGPQRFCSRECRASGPGGLRTRTCERCGAAFTPTCGRQRFCTPEHRDSAPASVPARECEHCGITFTPISSIHRFCCAEHRRAHRPTSIAGWLARIEQLEAAITTARSELRVRA